MDSIAIKSNNIDRLFNNQRPSKKESAAYILDQSEILDNNGKIQLANLLKNASLGLRDDVDGKITKSSVEEQLTNIFGQNTSNTSPADDINITNLTKAVFNVAQIMRPTQARIKEYFTQGITVSQTVKDLVEALTTGLVLSSESIKNDIVEKPYIQLINRERTLASVLRGIIAEAKSEYENELSSHDKLDRLLSTPIAGQQRAIPCSPFFTTKAVQLSKALLSGITDLGVHFICDNNGKIADVIFILLQNGYISELSSDSKHCLAFCLAFEAISLGLKGNEIMSKNETNIYLGSLNYILEAIEFTPLAERRNLRAIVNIGDFFDDHIDDVIHYTHEKLFFTDIKTRFLNNLHQNNMINQDKMVSVGKITLIYGSHDDSDIYADHPIPHEMQLAVYKTMRPFSIDCRHKSDFFIAHLPIFELTATHIHTGFGIIDISGCKNRDEVWDTMEEYYNENKGIIETRTNNRIIKLKSAAQVLFPTDQQINEVIKIIPAHPILGMEANRGKPLVIVHGHYNQHLDGLVQHDVLPVVKKGDKNGKITTGIQSNSQCGILNLNSYAPSLDGFVLGGCILQPSIEAQLKAKNHHTRPNNRIIA